MRTKHTLLFFMLAACARPSPEDEMRQAVANQSGDQIFFQDAQPEYLEFADRGTASLFSKLMRSGRYRVAPTNATLLCPGVSGDGVHGYSIGGVSVDTMMRDSAYARLYMDCVRDPQRCPSGEPTCVTWHSGIVRMSTEYLLVRKKGEWKVARPVSGGVAVPM
jgi:hypothetical protein